MRASSISRAVFAMPSLRSRPHLDGRSAPRLPGTVSAVVDGVEGGDLVAALDLEGVGSRPAAPAPRGAPSRATSCSRWESSRTSPRVVRITIGPTTTSDEIDRAASILPASSGGSGRRPGFGRMGLSGRSWPP